MSKSNIYLIPHTIIFNPERIPEFENFTETDSQFLHSLLYLNNTEILKNLNHNEQITFCLDELDSCCLPENIFKEEKIIYLRTNNLWNSLNNQIASAYIQNPQVMLFVMSNSMGITPQLISKALNLLNNDDNNIVIAATASGKVMFWGLNYYDEKIFGELDSFDFTYDNFLKLSGKSDNFLFTLNGLLTVENLDDFKSVYKILSTKESIEFCSHEKHELFTHLFIEYKEIL